MKKPPGELELETLRYISEHAPITVGEVAAQFGEPRGLARTTILTTMERLRAKGYLTRHAERGVFRYAPKTPQEVVMKDIVRDFVEKTLGGSLTPFVAYLSEADDLTEAEITELRRMVESLQAGREEGNP